MTPIHELEHSELFSFAETVLREIDVDRHLEDFFESLFCLKDRRGVGLLGDLCVVSRLVMTTNAIGSSALTRTTKRKGADRVRVRCFIANEH